VSSLDDLRTPSSALLGLAILLGTSERFLLQLEKQAESVLGAGTSDQHAPANTPAASQRVRLLGSQTSPSPTAATGEA
jgi:hypothetical protein